MLPAHEVGEFVDGGEPHDLEDLRRDFGRSGSVKVEESEVGGERFTALLAEDFASRATGMDVLRVARLIVAQINGARLVSATDRRPVRPTIVHEREGAGAWSRGTNYAEAVLEVGSARVRATAELRRADGTLVPEEPRIHPASRWLEFARSGTEDGDRAADVLNALSGNPDWADLWLAQEMFHHDRKQLAGWDDVEFEHFRRTATLYRHGPNSKNGNEAREWFAAQGKGEMDLNTARQVVARGARLWLDWKVP
jgi:hypothetical protein